MTKESNLALVVVPPPVTGKTLVTEAVCYEIGRVSRTQVRSVSRPPGVGRWAWVLRKYCFFLWSALTSPAPRVSRRSRYLYLASESQRGLLVMFVVVLIARVKGYVPVLHHHSFAYINSRSRVMAWTARIAGREALHVLLCDAMRCGFEQHYPFGRTTVVSNAAIVSSHGGEAKGEVGDINLAESDSPQRHNEPYRLGMLGNLTPEKGVPLAVAAVKEARECGIEVELLLAGPVSPELEPMMSAHVEYVRWLGPIGRREKNHFLSQLDLLLFPTTYVNEAQPMVVMESVSVGTPVHALQRGCLPSQLQPIPGCYVSSDASEFISNTIAVLCAGDLPARSSVAGAYAEAHETAKEQLRSLLALF